MGNILEGIIPKDPCIIHSVFYDLYFQTVLASYLMDIFRGCKSSLEWIPAQSPLETPVGVLLGELLKIKSVRGILYDRKNIIEGINKLL